LQGAASLALALALAAVPAVAQTMYKWVDADGKTQYSDRPPKGFKGELTRIEAENDTKPTLPRVLAPAPAPDAVDKAKAAKPDDILAKRRAARAQLEARLARARDNVDAAKKALEASDTPEPGDRQVIQQRSASGGMHGMTGRSNCREETTKDGRKIAMCPTTVPTPEYRDRVAELEEALRVAEVELHDAEQAWRRGVD